MVYLDYAAATPIAPEALKAMGPYFETLFANPSSIYTFAQKSRQAVDQSREDISAILGCKAREIIFTSGGTEANNLFLFGVAEQYSKRGKHIITTKIEHESVLRPLEQLEKQGYEVTYLPVGEGGVVSVDAVEKAMRKDTIIVAIMYANNEIGSIQPIAEIGKMIRSKKTEKTQPPFFFTDACQVTPYLPLLVDDLAIDAMVINSNKAYGPRGAGALYLREGINISPQLLGGGQEHRIRSGTENVPAIVGFSEALKIVRKNYIEESARQEKLRDELIDGILSSVPDSKLNGDKKVRLPNNVNISFKGLEGESILLKLDMLGIAASAGSACTAGSLEPSHVIRAIGRSDDWSHSSTRFTLGSPTTKEDILYVLEHLPDLIKELRELSPFV